MAQGEDASSAEAFRPLKRRRLDGEIRADVGNPLSLVQSQAACLDPEKLLGNVNDEMNGPYHDDIYGHFFYSDLVSDETFCQASADPILVDNGAKYQYTPQWLSNSYGAEAHLDHMQYSDLKPAQTSSIVNQEGEECLVNHNELASLDIAFSNADENYGDTARFISQEWLHPTYDESSMSSCCLPESDQSHPTDYSISGTMLDEKQHEQFHIICFGMISDIPILDLQSKIAETLALNAALIPEVPEKMGQPVRVKSQHNFVVGRLDDAYSKMITILLSEPSVQIQWTKAVIPTGKDFKTTSSTKTIIYGDHSLSERIGVFLTKYRVYLQRPTGCDRNVPYINPHDMTAIASVPQMTSSLSLPAISFAMRTSVQTNDPSQALTSSCTLLEADTPVAVKTLLLGHQKQALSFMLRREQGWDLESDEDDIWKLVEFNGIKAYCNSITQSVENHAPVQFKGGILADCMGLGKSLSIISLLASDGDAFSPPISRPLKRMPTLVIAPHALLSTWVDELSRHLHLETLRWCTYRRPTSRRDRDMILEYDIVITSYDTISAQWRNDASGGRFLFSTVWHRIVLDEAHEIRNSNSCRAKAVCALKSDRRWVVTGTPIQNRIQDLAGLLTFLRVFPDKNLAIMVSDKTVLPSLACLCLRRMTGTIDLPQRSDKIQYVEFSTEEAERYGLINQSIIGILESSNESRSYTNILAKINTMRQVCNLGLLYHQKNKDHVAPNISDKCSAQEIFDTMLSAGECICTWCGGDVSRDTDVNEDSVQEQTIDSGTSLRLSECGELSCSSCVADQPSSEFGEIQYCRHSSPCMSYVVTLLSPGSAWLSNGVDHKLPAKLLCLQRDLLALSAMDKSIIFSFWTSTLDVVERVLDKLNWPFSRVDGSMSNLQRQRAIATFRQDPGIRVILFSLRCGSTGLTMTEANHVFLMEPQWNPMVEDQAFARVHRLGQCKPVTTVRYIVKGTLEENIRNMQKGKRDLAQEAFAAQRRSTAWIKRIRTLLGTNT